MRFQFVDIEKSYPKALPKLKEIADKYKKTRPGFEATYELGNLFMDHEQPNKAFEWYDRAAESAPSQYEKSLALIASAASLENVFEYQKALERVDQALAIGVSSLKGEVLLSKARTLQGMKKIPDAKKIYDQVVTDFPNTSHAKKAEIFRAQIQ